MEAEAQMPLALAEVFCQGNLGVMNYYKMKNIMAFTAMRTAIDTGDSSERKDKS